jgi:hypothetical protein
MRSAMPGVPLTVAMVVGAMAMGAMAFAGCGSSSPAPSPPLSADGGIAASCQGAERCLQGRVKAHPSLAPLSDAKAELFAIYPNSGALPIASSPAKSGSFSFGNAPASARLWIRVVAKLDDGSGSPASIAAISGPFEASATAEITLRPVFLEIFQDRLAGGPLQVQWASARVYDPKSGRALSDATVTLRAGPANVPMPLQDVAGSKLHYATPKDLGGGTSFEMETTHAALGGSLTWRLSAEPPTFDVAVHAPAGGAKLPRSAPFEVRWAPQPASSYTVVDLFTSDGRTRKYVSAVDLSPDRTSETIPGQDPGSYVVDVRQARASCAGDGCVYSASTAALALAIE